uniref:Lon proteolytic domain-containing protein n=1 Tax=Globodera pallida TaxID=36090 RepID=A0A183BRH4_GLOPA
MNNAIADQRGNEICTDSQRTERGTRVIRNVYIVASALVPHISRSLASTLPSWVLFLALNLLTTKSSTKLRGRTFRRCLSSPHSSTKQLAPICLSQEVHVLWMSEAVTRGRWGTSCDGRTCCWMVNVQHEVLTLDNKEAKLVADLVAEGIDQFRRWFQTSSLTSMAWTSHRSSKLERCGPEDDALGVNGLRLWCVVFFQLFRQRQHWAKNAQIGVNGFATNPSDSALHSRLTGIRGRGEAQKWLRLCRTFFLWVSWLIAQAEAWRVGAATSLMTTTLPGGGGGIRGQTTTVRATSHRKPAGFVLIGDLAPDLRASYATARTLAENTVASRVQSDFFAGSHIEVRLYPNLMPYSGPSSGLACATALVSLALNIPMPTDVAMSGAIDAHGQITAVGNVVTKVQAAQEAGKTRIILPLANEGVLAMFGDVLEGINFFYFSTFAQVFDLLFV